MNKNIKALVLAGGYPQIALINELKKRGIFTILADYYAKPVAKAYADRFYQVSTLDIEAIRNVALRENVDFLITACTDQALLTVAKVSEMLGLPCYIDYQTALRVTNKSYMKRIFAQEGIPTARFLIMNMLDENALGAMDYPLIVKPVDCNSSKGVKKVNNIDELRMAFETAASLSRTNNVIIEEYIEGPELSVDVYVEDGVVHVLSISRSDKIPDQDKFVIFRGVCPADEAEPVREVIESVAQQIADSFNIKNSPMLIQLVTDGKRVFVLEFSARTGGGVKYLMIQKASGFDVIKAVVDLTMGLKPHVEQICAQSRYIVNEFLYCRNGIFDHLVGVEELKRAGIISDYYLFKWKGAELGSIQNSGDRVAGFTIQADTRSELVEKHRLAVERIEVVDCNGQDILRRDLLREIE